MESVPGRPLLRSASTGCVQLPRVLTSTGQRSFSFHGPTVWNSLPWVPSALRDDSPVFHWTRSRGSWRLICLDINAHHPAPFRRFVTLAPSINVMTHLLTYLLGCLESMQQLCSRFVKHQCHNSLHINLVGELHDLELKVFKSYSIYLLVSSSLRGNC